MGWGNGRSGRGSRWELGDVIDETVSMGLVEAIAVITGNDVREDPVSARTEASPNPEVCGACGTMIVLRKRHARFHVALAVLGEYLRGALDDEDAEPAQTTQASQGD